MFVDCKCSESEFTYVLRFVRTHIVGLVIWCESIVSIERVDISQLDYQYIYFPFAVLFYIYMNCSHPMRQMTDVNLWHSEISIIFISINKSFNFASNLIYTMYTVQSSRYFIKFPDNVRVAQRWGGVRLEKHRSQLFTGMVCSGFISSSSFWSFVC